MSALVGTGSLVRLALRRDRVLLPAWLAVFVLMAAGSAGATVGIYPTAASRAQAAASINDTPSLVALYGLVYDPTSLGAVALIKMIAFGAALVAVLSVVVVVRHTRAEEEAGRLELVGATVVGRHAPLAAALLVAVAANVVLGLVTAASLVAAGLPAPSSAAFGLAWAGVGIAFAAVAAVAAQVTESGRAAIGTACAVLGAAYVLRAIGDTSAASGSGPGWLSWLSPVGWGQQVRPYAGDRWWVLLLPAGFAAVLTAAAYALVLRRDHGGGLLPDRPGRPTTAPSLRGPLALAWRLQRGSLLGWTAGFVLLGVVFGNVASGVGRLVTSPQAREMISRLGGEHALTDAFMATELGFVGVLAAAFGVQAALRLRTEETALRAEPLLATPVRRLAWAGSHLTVALAGTAVLLAGAGLGAGLAHAAGTHDAGQVGRVLLGALVHAPAAWVVTGVVVAAFGLAPRLVVAGWVALVAFLLLGVLGPVFRLDQWAMDLSPFTHVPRLPGGELSATPLVCLVLVAAALVVVGLAGFRRRDIG
ncbi:ABC transporter permease [Gandjariella thermophila]|uniref:Exporter of polyketide antibiotics n=1 Tax=Gandjariella thermophila TaxID=1931992 RepID=A0A4D4JCG9_9PSEU|nr:ABC transporter permease [Gandjariella thermophila]GDY33062.1 exporter of polyketide antibiotics [Gandjariella thermophila]